VAAFSLVARTIGVVKDVYVASVFGMGDALDIFLMASAVPTFAISVFAGSFYAAFVPVFVAARDAKGQAAAKDLCARIGFIALSVLSIVTFLLSQVDEWLLGVFASEFSPGKLAQTIRLFDQLLPLITIGGLTVLGGAVLNAQKRFALVAVAPFFTPLAIIVVLYFYETGDKNISLLASGVLIGGTLELLVVLWGLYRLDYLCIPRWHQPDVNTRKVIAQYLPMVGGAFLMGGTVVVNQMMAAWLLPGTVSALNYANKVPLLITVLAATALGSAALPYISQQVAARDYNALRRTLVVYSKLIILLSVPFTLVGFFASERIIEILFQRGTFEREDTVVVGQMFKYSVLQIPPYILGALFAKYVSVLRGNAILLYVAVINLILNAALNYAMMAVMGGAGIALATAIVFSVSALILFWIARAEIKRSKFNLTM